MLVTTCTFTCAIRGDMCNFMNELYISATTCTTVDHLGGDMYNIKGEIIHIDQGMCTS